MIALALLLSAAPQQVPVDMILNGDFERQLTHLGASGVTIFGSYWIGAEGTDPGNSSHVQNVVSDGAGGHVLRIGSQTEHVILQRVPLPMRRLQPGEEWCPGGFQTEDESDVTLGFDVRGDSGSDAYVSVIAESGYHTCFQWKATPGSYVTALASDPRLTAWEPLQEILVNGTCNDMAATVSGDPSLYSQQGTSNSYGYWLAQIEGDMALQAIWTAPYTGIVRVYDRPAPFVATTGIPAGAPQSFRHEVFYVPTGGTCSLSGPISSLVVADSSSNTDKDGVLVVKRLDVTKGDRIVFRISNDVVSNPDEIRIQWHPALRYETYCVDDDADGNCDDPDEIQGRRVTYYTGTAPAARLGETLVQVATTTSSTFTTFSNLEPLQLSGDPLGDPYGALDIELGSFDTTKNVEFDDVSCLVEFDDVADEDELHEQLLTDVTRSRDNELYRRDRDATHDNACGDSMNFDGDQGSTPTPFVCHPLHIDNGPSTLFQDGGIPFVAAERQKVAFDLQDYLDLDYIGEALGQRANAGTFIDPSEAYDCANDTWGTPPSEVGLNPAQHLERYVDLGDVDELRHALALCYLASARGVVTASGDPRVGTILSNGYAQNGTNQYVDTKAEVDLMSDQWLFMDMPATMVRTYAECARYIDANGNPGGFLSTTKMAAIWDAAAVAAAKGADLKHFWEHSTPAYGEWEGTWLFLASYFNDTWGYGAGASWAAVHALESMPTGWTLHTGATSVAAMKQIFYNGFIINGGYSHFLDLWEHNTCRYAAGAADQFRAWLSYAELYDYVEALNPSHALLPRLGRVLHEAAINILKFQYPGSAPGSVWYNSSQEAFQQIDLIGSYATLAYGPQIGLTGGAVALHALTGTPRDEMLDCMATVARVTNAHFGHEFGHQLGVAAFSTGPTIPAEGRALTGETDIMKALVTTGSALATVGISLADLQSTPPGTVQFTVTATSSTIQQVVDDYASIVVWSYDTSGDWILTDLWSPGGGGSLSAPSISGGTATFTYNNSLSGDVKFRIATWTPEGKWTAKTSYQEW